MNPHLQRTNLGVWTSYIAPRLSGASELNGIVVEVLTGDTVAILPQGEKYDSEAKLRKISLASVRAPRAGNEKMGKADEPYARECKNRLKGLLSGKSVKVSVHYERDIPMGTVRYRSYNSSFWYHRSSYRILSNKRNPKS